MTNTTTQFSDLVNAMVASGINKAIKEAAENAIKKAKADIEKEISNSLANIAVSVQRQLLVYENQHRVVIEIRGKL